MFFDYSAAESDLNIKSNKSGMAAKVEMLMNATPPKAKANMHKGVMPKFAQTKKPTYKAPTQPVVIASNDSNEKGKAVDEVINDHIPKEQENEYSLVGKSLIKKDKKIYMSDYSVQTYSVSKNKKEDLNNFEVRFQDDQDEIKQDFGDGQISIKVKMNNSMMIRRGTVFSSDHYPTTDRVLLRR